MRGRTLQPASVRLQFWRLEQVARCQQGPTSQAVAPTAREATPLSTGRQAQSPHMHTPCACRSLTAGPFWQKGLICASPPPARAAQGHLGAVRKLGR